MKVWLKRIRSEYNTVKSKHKGCDVYDDVVEYAEGNFLTADNGKRVVILEPFTDNVLMDVSKSLFSRLCTCGDVELQEPSTKSRH